MSETHSILAANQAFYRAFEKKDIDAMEQICSQGTDTLCVHPGRSSLKGWKAIRNSWVQIFRATNYLEIETEIVSVQENGDLAYVVLVEEVMQVSRGRQVKARSMATNIFERLGDKWYLIHHHGSPIM